MKFKGEVLANKIELYNADNMCSEKYCSNMITHYIQVEINNVEVMIALCKKHAQVMENGNFKELIEIPTIECTDNGNNYVFDCIYCGKQHIHGRKEGHRIAHCTRPSPYKKIGYYLKIFN